MTTYNPYDMVEVIFNGHDTYARPIKLDSDIVDFDEMTNKDGDLVKPIEFSTTCPDCGDGVQITAIIQGPPFKLEYTCSDYCPKCPIKKSSAINPFRKPPETIDPAISDTITPVKEKHNFEEATVIKENFVEKILDSIEPTEPTAEVIESVEPTAEIIKPIEPVAEIIEPVDNIEHIDNITIDTVEDISENEELMDVLNTIDDKPKALKKPRKPKKEAE